MKEKRQYVNFREVFPSWIIMEKLRPVKLLLPNFSEEEITGSLVRGARNTPAGGNIRAVSRDRENVTPKGWKMGQGKCHPLSFFLYETRTP
jgi:hypothetical protein